MTNNKKSNRYQDWSEKKYIIACDLDGTLLNKNSQLSNDTIEGLKYVSSLGHKVCLITGRPIQGAIDFYNQIGLKTILCNLNGSYISNPSDPSFIPFAIPFSKEILFQLFNNKNLMKYVNLSLIEGINKGWLVQNNSQCKNNCFEDMKDLFHLNDRDIKYIDHDLKDINTDIVGILFHIDNIDDKINSIIYEIKKIAPTLVVRTWNLKNITGLVIEINSAFSSKGTAVEFLSSYYGIPLEQCIAFGDGDNDVSMLTTATWGFAMKNATNAAQLSARFLTKYDNNENGVIRELKKFLKI